VLEEIVAAFGLVALLRVGVSVIAQAWRANWAEREGRLGGRYALCAAMLLGGFGRLGIAAWLISTPSLFSRHEPCLYALSLGTCASSRFSFRAPISPAHFPSPAVRKANNLLYYGAQQRCSSYPGMRSAVVFRALVTSLSAAAAFAGVVGSGRAYLAANSFSILLPDARQAFVSAVLWTTLFLRLVLALSWYGDSAGWADAQLLSNAPMRRALRNGAGLAARRTAGRATACAAPPRTHAPAKAPWRARNAFFLAWHTTPQALLAACFLPVLPC